MSYLNNLESNFMSLKKSDKEVIIQDVELQHLLGNLIYGKIIEIFGAESSGKTTFLYYILNKLNFNPLLIDTEYTFDYDYASTKFSAKDTIVCSENNIDKVLKIIKQFIKQDLVNVICIDSLSGLDFETFKDIELFFDKLVDLIKDKKIIVFITNQMRDYILKRRTVAFGNKRMKQIYFKRLKTTKHKAYKGFEIMITDINEKINKKESIIVC